MKKATPAYDRNRTDNIEPLYKALFYLQLTNQPEKTTKPIKKELMREFDAFPVRFDKHKLASRVSHPYTYHESGVVTFTLAEPGEQILLDPWVPENRPVPKTKTKKATNYNALFDVNPIWYVQLMQFEQRKPVKRKSIMRGYRTGYKQKYKEYQIISELKDDMDSQTENMMDLHDEDAGSYCRTTLMDFAIYPWPFEKYNDFCFEHREQEPPFFFLNQNEMEQLAIAFAKDNATGPLNQTHKHPFVIEAIREIIEDKPNNRTYLNVGSLTANTRYVGINHGLYFTESIYDHTVIWEKLHEQFTQLSDEQLASLDALHLVDFDLLSAMNMNKQEG